MEDPFAVIEQSSGSFPLVPAEFTARVRKVLTNELKDSGHGLADFTVLTNFFQIDSLDAIGLAMAFEEEFGIDIPDEAVMGLNWETTYLELCQKLLQLTMAAGVSRCTIENTSASEESSTLTVNTQTSGRR